MSPTFGTSVLQRQAERDRVVKLSSARSLIDLKFQGFGELIGIIVFLDCHQPQGAVVIIGTRVDENGSVVVSHPRSAHMLVGGTFRPLEVEACRIGILLQLDHE